MGEKKGKGKKRRQSCTRKKKRKWTISSLLGNHGECSHRTVVDTRLACRAIVHPFLLEPCNTVLHFKEVFRAHLNTGLTPNAFVDVNHGI